MEGDPHSQINYIFSSIGPVM